MHISSDYFLKTTSVELFQTVFDYFKSLQVKERKNLEERNE